MINILEYLDRIDDFSSVAMIEGDRQITFRELNESVRRLAFNFRGHRNRPVAVLLPKSIDCAIADLAIIHSGNFYVNLDVNAPPKRNEEIVGLINPVFIVSKTTDALSGEELERAEIIDTDPMCIINTSGSTGIPKGVVLNHRSFIDFMNFTHDKLGINKKEVIGSLSPAIFDIWSYELCMMISTGSTIKILDSSLASYPADLLRSMTDVTFIFWVPTIMVNIANLNLLDHIPLPALKTVWFAGDVFPTKQFNYWYRHLPLTTFVNLYGPIEITLDCTYFVINREYRDDEPIPIGYPCKNTDVLILDGDKEAVEGELCVRGTSLAMGYFNNPEKTAEAFVQNPLNKSYPEIIYRTGDYVTRNERGELIFKGRKDTLIKHRGYRIELGEIEHIIINSLGLVPNGCAIYKNNMILFYYEGPEMSEINFIHALNRVVPKYMIPCRFIHIDLLPVNTNGKIDRLCLSRQ